MPASARIEAQRSGGDVLALAGGHPINATAAPSVESAFDRNKTAATITQLFEEGRA